jgi:hypothetical protein
VTCHVSLMSHDAAAVTTGGSRVADAAAGHAPHWQNRLPIGTLPG